MTKEEGEIWKAGYDAGILETLRQHKASIAIGIAILHVLDERYQFSKEDY